MAVYYVSKEGSDANNGLSPDASAVTNKPWLTIGKALGAAGIASGDTVYIGPGTYREVVTVAMTSATAETSVLGDPGNAQGFKTAGGVLVSPAEVIWTAYTTNDTTAPGGSPATLVGRDYFTFRYLTFVSGSSITINATTQTSTNIVFRDCAFFHEATAINIDGAFGTTIAWTIERCIFRQTSGSSNIAIDLRNDTGAGADYDLAVTIRNCAFYGLGGAGVICAPSGGLANKPGGMIVYNCTFFSGTTCVQTLDTSSSIVCRVYNCLLFAKNAGLVANFVGDLLENYNRISASTTHTNVTQGANTVVGDVRAPNFQVGQELLYGFTSRMYLSPSNSSWMLTFGNDGTYTTSEDLLGLPRPGGGASATKGIGYLGRGNTFTKETGTVRTGSNAISITGPGTQDFQLPVDASSTTATVYVRWDATYAGTKPLMKVLDGGECGVTDATATATGASGAWEQISLTFTPARVGIVTIRLQSSDTNGAGVMFADDFSVT